MISQEIKLYEEPQPIVQQSYSTSSYTSNSTYTQKTIDGELDIIEMMEIRVGQKYRYKSSGITFEIKRFETNPAFVKEIYHNPGIIICMKETTAGGEVPFSLAELCGAHMELVTNV